MEFKVNNAPEAYAALADVAGVKAAEVADALRAGSRLERIGMVENLISEHNITDLADLMKGSEKLPPVLMREYRDTSELMAVFTRPSVRSELALSDFAFVKEDADVLVSLLQNAVAGKEQGVNVLLYGPPGTGKTELAKVVAQAAGLDLFEVEDVFPPISSEAAQLMARSDQLSAPANGSVNGKAWVNQILESNTVPTLWVTNRIEQIDPAFRRRFAYHLELRSPPPGEREGLVRKTLEGVEVSDAFVAKLTARKGLTPAQIRTAVRFARLANTPSAPDEKADASATMESLIDRQLKNADVALGNKADAAGRKSVTTYDLTMLNVESRFEIPRIVEALKTRGHGALCFYGAPGTGKTALAEHIAKALDKPLIIKQASDLMSKYVGETEQNMAAMFKEAEEEKAVLLLDEADSFLQDRRGAQRTYEVTEVNEMLQGMERHNGIFICTTNLLESIDQAALRRFTFKIKFMPLTATQREAMFVTEVLAGDATLLTNELSARLAKLTQICLGDFAAVKRQTDILAATFSGDEFMSQLEAEHRIKPEVREARGMGFVH